MELITSRQNTLIKKIAELKQKKTRQEQQLFIVEGKRSLEEALASDWVLQELFCLEDASQACRNLMALLPDSQCHLVTTEVMAKLADTTTPQGVLGVMQMRQASLAPLLTKQGLILALDGVRDPGNVGTIIRTADAAGLAGVILLEECADIYSPKVVRSTMGSLFHLPVVTTTREELIASARAAGWELWVSTLEGGTDVYATDCADKIVLVLGNEAFGASAAMQEAATRKVYLPMAGQAESLNVAVAGGVFAFDITRRQRLQ